MEQIENEEIDLYKFVHLLLTKEKNHSSERERGFSVNGAEKTRICKDLRLRWPRNPYNGHVGAVITTPPLAL